MIHNDQPFFPGTVTPKTNRVISFALLDEVNEYLRKYHGEVTSLAVTETGSFNTFWVAINAYHPMSKEDK